MEFLSGGFYKAAIHQVVQPPADQRGYMRLGAFHSAMPSDDVKLMSLSESPVLRKHGMKRRFDGERAPTAEVWRKERTVAHGQTELKARKGDGVEEEYINGVLMKHHN